MRTELHSVVVTTASDGSATAYIGGASAPSDALGGLNGELLAVVYEKHGSTPFADGVDFTITTERFGFGVWTESNVNAAKLVQPLRLAQDLVGADLTAIYERVPLVGDRVKIVIASGGDTKIGTFSAILGV